MTALKTLVLTSTPSSPNRQLHPQLQSSGSRGSYRRGAGHIRTNSVGAAFQTSSGKPEPSTVSIQSVATEEREVSGRNFFSPELAHFFFPLASSPFQSTPSHRAEFSSHFPSAATNLSLTCSSCLLLVFSSFLSLLFLLSSL